MSITRNGREVDVLEANKSTRIGDILMERGIISRAQLLQALDLQQARYLLSNPDAAAKSRNEIGELLIELGFITRDQLKKNLARQNRLRKTTLVFTLVAPLFTMACGGGGGGSAPASGSGTNSVSSVVVTQSSRSSQTPSSAGATQSSDAADDSDSSKSTVSSSSSSSSSIAALSSSSKAPEPVSSVASSVQASSIKTSSSASSTKVDGAVVLYWTVPRLRENGEHLDINEISGYEIRYKLRKGRDFSYISIPSGFTDTYYFDYLSGDYEFQIAAVDINGIYSRFVPINPVL